MNINPAWTSVAAVVEAGLCTQCGACVSMCPHNNVEIYRDKHFRFYPAVVAPDACIQKCKSMCVEICAGVHEDPGLWKKEPIVPATYEEFCNGPILKTYVGYSRDAGIRNRASSGGLVTSLLVYLLDSRQIDGVLLVGPTGPTPTEHEIKVARTRAEIEDACGSKYYPMPIGERFRELLSFSERYAVVLLGCQMRSLRLLERRIAPLRRSILLRIGLICGYCSGFKATADQVREWGIKRDSDIYRIDYRDGKWPGKFRVQAAGGIDKSAVIYEFLERLPFTTNLRCMICSDLMNETADITVGDAWLRQLTDRKDEGWSIAAARNLEALNYLEAAAREGAVYLEAVDNATLAKTQEKPMRYKKDALRVRLWFVGTILHRTVPDNDFDRFAAHFNANLWNKTGNVLFLLTLCIFFQRDRFRRWVFQYVPRALLRKYVRMIFLMIAHDGVRSFVAKLLLGKEPALNCDV